MNNERENYKLINPLSGLDTVSNDKSRSSISFPVAAIGASAGGLEAISELLSNLASDTGMAFLIVQHLDPSHPSMLVDILSKKTQMSVIQAADGLKVETNCVYVISPNTRMTIAQGHLILKARDDSQGAPMPIDDLFYSLAEDRGSNAIGISLSGSGSDGALGMQAIKGEGGLTFAQDEASAKFNSMPKAAIELGCVDFVLPPEKIAVELARISKHPFMATPSLLLDVEHVAADEESLKRLFDLLNSVCNVDFTNYKRGTITRRLARRIALMNLNSLPAYIDFLESNPEEIYALYQDLLIRVTSFFRDPEAFEELTNIIFPGLMGKISSTKSIRIWVPGCSSGEEVYSIAICLLEFLGDRAAQIKIQIFGTDVSEPVLAIARSGIYVENITREVSEERLQRFFIKTNGRYQISQSIRNLCVFAHQNVTRDPPFSQLDLISCRNLLIYFDSSMQKRVISLFHYALNPGGFLMLGPSETIGSSSDLFTVTASKKFKIYTKKSVPATVQLEYLRAEGNKPAYKALYKSPQALTDSEKQKREVDRIALARYAPAGVVCDENLNVLEFRGDTGPYLIQPSGPPSTNLRQLARPGLLVEISNMVKEAGESGVPVKKTAVRVEMASGIQDVNLEVIPTPKHTGGNTWFLIFFKECHLNEKAKEKDILYFINAFVGCFKGRQSKKANLQIAMETESLHLRQELDATRRHIKMMFEEHDASQEELKASQEELLSSNEEFQSTNEELETAKEELQSSNEELATTNDELRHRFKEVEGANQRLEEARNYSDAIVETIREPLLVLDKSLRILRANNAFYTCFKLSPEETENCLFYDLDNRQWDIPALRELLGKVLPQDMAFQGYEITTVFPAIGEKTMLLNGRHLAWDDQTLILLAISDITEHKTLQNNLKEADRRKDEFLAMLAHELRNPLAPIRNALEIWRRGDAGEKAEKEAQMVMDRQLTKETRLVDDLLDVARITSGSIAIKREPVDLVQIVHQAVEGTKHQYEDKSHSFNIDVPESSIIVEGDTVRLEQIVSNLLTNAAKYTKPNGKISLTLESQGGMALLIIKDNGIGIASHLLPRIFDLFVQASVSIDRAQGGLGIGLTLVHRLVELQGGTIQARSDGLDKGSEFIVSFPISSKAAVHPPSAGKAPISKVAPSGFRRILVVDDNVDSATTSALLLELEGHDVHTAFDGPAALKEAHEFEPDVVLLDIGLPGMNGYEVAHHLREMPETKKSLLIALSGYGQVEDISRSKEAGFNYHLVKPANLNHISALVSGYTGSEI